MTMVLNGTSGVTTNSGTLISATTIGVGGTTPSASGAGITFPAAQSASSDANTLDDYEEGTWSPGIAFNGTSVGVAYSGAGQVGTYVKIGKQVTVSCYMLLTNKGSSTGTVTIGGLPFANSSGTSCYSVGVVTPSNYTGITEQVSVLLTPSVNYVALFKGFNSAQNMTNTDILNTSNPIFTLTYFIS